MTNLALHTEGHFLPPCLGTPNMALLSPEKWVAQYLFCDNVGKGACRTLLADRHVLNSKLSSLGNPG